MMKNYTKISLLFFILSLFCLTSFSQDANSGKWLQFRGNNSEGIVNLKENLKAWPEKGPELLWKKEIGSAYSEVIVENGIAYTMSSENTDSINGWEYLSAFDANTGDEKWKTSVDSLYIEIDGWGHGPRSTPTISEDMIYCLSGNGTLSALDKNKGSLKWSVDLVDTYRSTRPRWGFSTSPIIKDDLLYIEAGGAENKAFIALNKKTGKLVWSNGQGAAGYSTPKIISVDGIDQIIFANGRNVYSYSLKGESLWTMPTKIISPNPMPVFIAPNKIFLSTVNTSMCSLLKIEGNTPTTIYDTTTMRNDFSTSCYKDGLLYGIDLASVACVSEKDGSRKWKKRGFGKGSLIIVGDKLIILSDRGKLALAETNTDIFTEISSFQAIEGKCWTAPSYADGKLYIRNLSQIACFKLN